MKFLNASDEVHSLRLVVRRELGILARIALVFSRRGLDILELDYAGMTGTDQRQVLLSFTGSNAQSASVCADLRKLIDVVAVDVLSESQPVRKRPWNSKSTTSKMPIYAGYANARSESLVMAAKATHMP